MRHVLPLLLIASAALSQGCTLFVTVPPLDPLPKDKVILKDVAYTPQEDSSDCGPACLATMMRHSGSNLTLPEVKSQLKQASGGGTLWLEMMYGARKNGFRCILYESSINDLRRSMLAGRPLILMLHTMPNITRCTGMRRGHYVVAVGYDDTEREVVIHTGTDAFDTMSYRQLQLQWSRANFMALLVWE